MSQTINDDLIITGSLVAEGGLQVSNLHVDHLTGGIELTGDLAVPGTLTTTGITTINSTINSTDKFTGALVLKGGLGVMNDVNIGGKVKSNDIEATTQVKGNTIVSTTSVSAVTVNASVSMTVPLLTASTQIDAPIVNAATSITTPTINATALQNISTINGIAIAEYSRPPIGTIYFQGPHDTTPGTLWGGTWTDVSYEEAGLFRRVVGTNTNPNYTHPFDVSGTINATGTTTTIVILMTAPSTTIAVGDWIYSSNNQQWRQITVVTSQTQFTVGVAFSVIPSSTVKFAQRDTFQDHQHIFYNRQTGRGDTSSSSAEIWKAQVGSYTWGTSGRAGGETRPSNISVRKWRRTA